MLFRSRTFDCTVQVLSTNKGSNLNLVSQGVGTLTVLPTALLWLALQPSTTSLVKAGTSIVVSGKVTKRQTGRLLHGSG